MAGLCSETISFFNRLCYLIRTKARQGQSDGESGEVCCEFASLSGTLLMVETRRYSRSFAYVARPRCRLFLRPRTPRPPTEQPFGIRV